MSTAAHRRAARIALEVMPAISRALSRGDKTEALAVLAMLYRDAGETHDGALALAHVALDQLVSA